MSDVIVIVDETTMNSIPPDEPERLVRDHINRRAAALHLNTKQLTARLGIKDLSKARRRIDGFCRGHDLRPGHPFRARLATALELPVSEIDAWAAAAAEARRFRHHAAWLAEFTPHAIVLTGRHGCPKSITMAALCGALRHRRIEFPPNLCPTDFLPHSLETIRTRKELNWFYPPEGVVIHSTPTCFNQYDLEGRLVQQRETPEYLGVACVRLR